MSWRSFIQGMGSIFDIFGPAFSPYPRHYKWRRPMTDEEALRSDQEALASDWKALASDWQVVGNDLKRAAAKVRHT